MALKRDMRILETDNSYYIDVTASMGDLACASTAGSGVNLDNSANICTIKADPSGYSPVGVLLTDVVDVDPDSDYRTKEKVVAYKDGKVALMNKCIITTNKVIGTPTNKGSVYPAHSGYICASQYGGMSAIGTFQGTADENGYVRVRIDID